MLGRNSIWKLIRAMYLMRCRERRPRVLILHTVIWDGDGAVGLRLKGAVRLDISAVAD